MPGSPEIVVDLKPIMKTAARLSEIEAAQRERSIIPCCRQGAARLTSEHGLARRSPPLTRRTIRIGCARRRTPSRRGRARRAHAEGGAPQRLDAEFHAARWIRAGEAVDCSEALI
jgi:hypothetical protein